MRLSMRRIFIFVECAFGHVKGEKRMRNKNTEKKSHKGLVAALALVATIAAIVAVYFSVLLQSSNITKRQGLLDGAYGNVLNIDGIVEANPHITDIAMLGSHDASSDGISVTSRLDPEDDDSALGIFFPLIKGMMYRYAKTQTVGVYQQLMQGARYLNLKCSRYTDGEWYGEHALLSNRLEVYITDIVRFLSEHPGEIVLLQLEPQSLGAGGTLSMLYNLIASVKYTYNGKEWGLMDFVRYGKVNTFNLANSDGITIGELTYNQVTDSGRSAGVVLFVKRVYGRYNYVHEFGFGQYDKYYFDLTRNAFNDWHNRLDDESLFEAIGESAEWLSNNAYYRDKLRINQTQGSFNIKDLRAVITEWSLLDFALKHNADIVNHPDFEKWLSEMPIVLVDFVNSDEGDFNRIINKKILDYNTNLINKLNGK